MYTTTPTLSDATRATRRTPVSSRKPAQEKVDTKAFRAAQARVLAEYETRRQAKAWEALRSQAFRVPAGIFGKAA